MTKVKASKVQPQAPIHEIDANGCHRIVAFRSGIPERSQWFQPYEIAFFRNYRASTQERGGIPKGIFTIREAAFETLA